MATEATGQPDPGAGAYVIVFAALTLGAAGLAAVLTVVLFG